MKRFQWMGLLLVVALMAVFSGSTIAQDRLPGTEEFGLSMAELVNSVEEIEGLISDCMNAAGFEYIAVDFNTIRRGMVSDKSLPGMSEREFMVEYGFGISTFYTGLAPQLSDLMRPAQIGLGERNIEIFRNLPPTDQVAYNHTLFGDNPDINLAIALEIEDFSRTGGCTRTAIEQVFTEEEMSATYLNPLDALIEQDPRMAAAIVAFSECMRAQGFEYSHPIDIERDFRNRLDAITEDLPLEALSADALSALEALQAEERAVAVVTLDCEQRIIDPVESQVERDLYNG